MALTAFFESKVLNSSLLQNRNLSEMSDDNQNNKNRYFSNEDTIVRRAWIESALAGARSSVLTGQLSASDLPEASVPAHEPDQAHDSRPSGPYLAWSASERRSGT